MKYSNYTLLIIAIATFSCCSNRCIAQFEQQWAWGQKAGLDFNTSPPTPFLTGFGGFGEAAASICDEYGQLLFYTNGSDVWNRNHDRMTNGVNLTGITGDLGLSGTPSTAQGALIVPFPNDKDKYYIFSLTSREFEENAGRLYYSVVNMQLNGGLGDIIPAEKGVFLDSGYFNEGMTAVLGDRCNVWVLLAKTYNRPPYSKGFRAFEVTDMGVNKEPVYSSLEDDYAYTLLNGTLAISPNRKKVFCGGVLSDFDPLTGVVDKPVIIGNAGGYGWCFSPDNSKLYSAGNAYIYQYDLRYNIADSIDASRTLIAYLGFGNSSGHLKTGPDEKIYFASSAYSLGVINYPNLNGLACGLVSNAITLLGGTRMHEVGGLPNVVPAVNRRKDSSIAATTVSATCFAGQVVLSAGNDSTGHWYLWNTGDSIPEIEVKNPGTYYVRYYTYSPCIYHTDTFHVDFSNGMLPVIEIMPSCPNEAGGKAWISRRADDTVSYRYKWINSQDSVLSYADTLDRVAAGKYRLTIATHTGCDTTLTFEIPEYPANHVSFSCDSIVCAGEAVAFENTSEDYFGTFHWYFGDNTYSALTHPVHTYLSGGVYRVALVGSGAVCSDTAYKTIIVDAPAGHLTLTADTKEACTGEQVYFSTELQDSTFRSFSWQLDDVTILTTPVYSVSHAYDRSGHIPIVLTARYRACPEITANDTITIYPLPVVSLGQDSALCLKGNSITLQNTHPHQEGDQYFWSTGDTSPSLNVNREGNYSLRVSNRHGCVATGDIKVRKGCYIDIPNAFSPNGDGVNDYFFPRQLHSEGIVSFSMQVFNRYGQLLFETEQSAGRGWDGRWQRQNQPAGVYVYIIQLDFENGITERYTGNLTLIR